MANNEMIQKKQKDLVGNETKTIEQKFQLSGRYTILARAPHPHENSGLILK
jgi:hypothetical protein